MTADIKSGQEVVDEFFDEILKIKVLDKKVVEVLINLYRKNKLTDINLSNELARLREGRVE